MSRDRRLTTAELDAIVARINREAGAPNEPFTSATRTHNVGNYHLNYAYGGVKLVRVDNKAGGTTDVLHLGYVSKRALRDAMWSFIYGMQAVEDAVLLKQAEANDHE